MTHPLLTSDWITEALIEIACGDGDEDCIAETAVDTAISEESVTCSDDERIAMIAEVARQGLDMRDLERDGRRAEHDRVMGPVFVRAQYMGDRV